MSETPDTSDRDGTDETLPASEEPRDVDVFDNAEVHAVQDGASRPVARASDSGQPPTPHRTPEDPLGTQDPAEGGTADGDPTAGVRISAEDAADAVPGDQGPEHPGTR